MVDTFVTFCTSDWSYSQIRMLLCVSSSSRICGIYSHFQLQCREDPNIILIYCKHTCTSISCSYCNCYLAPISERIVADWPKLSSEHFLVYSKFLWHQSVNETHLTFANCSILGPWQIYSLWQFPWNQCMNNFFFVEAVVTGC